MGSCVLHAIQGQIKAVQVVATKESVLEMEVGVKLSLVVAASTVTVVIQ
jgi:hypothetical protein